MEGSGAVPGRRRNGANGETAASYERPAILHIRDAEGDVLEVEVALGVEIRAGERGDRNWRRLFSR